ncbi:hypothetical protein EDB82DRAFT_139179 [Fusarium venenatum]|uniref:uncharacterized protein n=1 Tax=Fusarium venenatum TaxID=56646 RepID=UPI001D6B81CB|nr:hypothetical protein EDB82DRAFT_139179 [Fusarium venenatum]
MRTCTPLVCAPTLQAFVLMSKTSHFSWSAPILACICFCPLGKCHVTKERMKRTDCSSSIRSTLSFWEYFPGLRAGVIRKKSLCDSHVASSNVDTYGGRFHSIIKEGKYVVGSR